MILETSHHRALLFLLMPLFLSACQSGFSSTYYDEDHSAISELTREDDEYRFAHVYLTSEPLVSLTAPLRETGECYCDHEACVRKDAIESVRVFRHGEKFEPGLIVMTPVVITGLAVICAVSESDRQSSEYCKSLNPANLLDKNETPTPQSENVRPDPLKVEFCPKETESYTIENEPADGPNITDHK